MDFIYIFYEYKDQLYMIQTIFGDFIAIKKNEKRKINMRKFCHYL